MATCNKWQMYVKYRVSASRAKVVLHDMVVESILELGRADLLRM